MKYFGNIYLSWRRGIGTRRHIVGVLKRSSTQGVVFSYLPKGVNTAIEEGFDAYTEFPDRAKLYTKNVLEIFSQRLTPSERQDSKRLYEFWKVPSAYYKDPFGLLAFTQGWLPTDHFEFLATFNPINGLSFVTDLAGLTSLKMPANTVKIGDLLTWEYEHDNAYDKNAIAIFSSNTKIGYIKQVHTKLFHKKYSENIKLKIHSLEQNGVIKRIFVNVNI